MSIDGCFEREEEALRERYHAGHISLDEYRREMRGLNAEYREAIAEEMDRERGDFDNYRTHRF